MTHFLRWGPVAHAPDRMRARRISRRRRGLGAVLAVFVVAGCGSGSVTSDPSRIPSSPGLTPSPTTGLEHLPLYGEGDSHPIPAGTYVTRKPYGFFPGLELTIPPGWSATETDAGELALHPDDRPDDLLLLWKDMAPVVTHNRDQKVGQVRQDVGRTGKELIDWLTTTPDFAVLSDPASAVAGSSIKGTQLTLGVARSADFGWNDCPDNPHCAAILTDPRHWGDGFYAIGGDEVARMFIATVHYPDADHTFFITLDTPNRAEMARFADDAEPIIRSLRLPGTFTKN